MKMIDAVIWCLANFIGSNKDIRDAVLARVGILD